MNKKKPNTLFLEEYLGTIMLLQYWEKVVESKSFEVEEITIDQKGFKHVMIFVIHNLCLQKHGKEVNSPKTKQMDIFVKQTI